MSNTVKTSKPVVKETSRVKTLVKKTDISIKTVIRNISKEKTSDPLTKKILIKAASEGFSKAAAQTMKVMGYNVIVKDGWVVKKFADGSIKKISKLEQTNKPVILD